MNNNQQGKREKKSYDKSSWDILTDKDIGHSTSHYISQLKKELIKEGYDPIQVTITIDVIGEKPPTAPNKKI